MDWLYSDGRYFLFLLLAICPYLHFLAALPAGCCWWVLRKSVASSPACETSQWAAGRAWQVLDGRQPQVGQEEVWQSLRRRSCMGNQTHCSLIGFTPAANQIPWGSAPYRMKPETPLGCPSDLSAPLFAVFCCNKQFWQELAKGIISIFTGFHWNLK